MVEVGCNEKKLQDGFCDDDQNTMTCNYDGGDCCMWPVPYATYQGRPENVAYFINDFRCQECMCKNPSVSKRTAKISKFHKWIAFQNSWKWGIIWGMITSGRCSNSCKIFLDITIIHVG